MPEPNSSFMTNKTMSTCVYRIRITRPVSLILCMMKPTDDE